MSQRYAGGTLSVGLDGINSPVTQVEYLVVAGGVVVEIVLLLVVIPLVAVAVRVAC